MRPARALAALLALGGCWSEQRFREEADEATCAWLADCIEGTDYETCLDDAGRAWTPVPETCDYHPGRARRCVKQIDRLACPTAEDGGGMPEICDEVWDCQ